MTFSCPTASWDEVLKMATTYGYDAVEPRIGSGQSHGVETDADAATRTARRAAAEKAGIAMAAVACSARYADPTTTEENVQLTLDAIDLAADIGAKRLRVFGGKLGEGMSREDAIKHVADALTSVAPRARERGVYVCVETHDDWCDPKHVAAMLERASDEFIACNWDIMHPVRVAGSTMDEAYNILKPWIHHCHIHDGITTDDGKLEMVPIGEGAIDHRRALELLEADGYDGYMSGEWINWQPAEEHLPREIKLMRDIEKAIAANG